MLRLLLGLRAYLERLKRGGSLHNAPSRVSTYFPRFVVWSGGTARAAAYALSLYLIAIHCPNLHCELISKILQNVFQTLSLSGSQADGCHKGSHFHRTASF